MGPSWTILGPSESHLKAIFGPSWATPSLQRGRQRARLSSPLSRRGGQGIRLSPPLSREEGSGQGSPLLSPQEGGRGQGTLLSLARKAGGKTLLSFLHKREAGSRLSPPLPSEEGKGAMLSSPPSRRGMQLQGSPLPSLTTKAGGRKVLFPSLQNRGAGSQTLRLFPPLSIEDGRDRGYRKALRFSLHKREAGGKALSPSL